MPAARVTPRTLSDPARQPAFLLVRALSALALAASAAGCAALTEDRTTVISEPPPTTAVAGPASGADPGSESSAASAAGAGAGGQDGVVAAPTTDWCTGLTVEAGPTVDDPDLTELSGLAASERSPGVLWAINDSGHAPALHAVGAKGQDLGTFPLEGLDDALTAASDAEDIAVSQGMVYVADIGDNNNNRGQVAVYRFPEPDPAAPGPIRGAEVLRLRYPGGPRDAEALLVDPVSGELVIIDKSFRIASGGAAMLAAAEANVYVAAPPFDTEGVTILRATGAVALDDLATRTTAEPVENEASLYGLTGVATAADIRADGAVVAVRTYGTVWLFDRAEGQSIVQALAGAPCEAPTMAEDQGESVAFLPGDGLTLVTGSEGANPELHRISRP